MLYSRSSFIKWLTEVKDCEVIPKPDSSVITIKNGMVKAYMYANSKNVIDYEEIYALCNKLYIVGLPGNSDLELIE